MSNLSFLAGGGATEVLGVSGSDGTTLTSGGSSGTKGTFVSLGTTSFEYQYIAISSRGPGVTRPMQLDIAIGATPDIIVADYFFDAGSSTDNLSFNLPICIPAGVAVKMRHASNIGGNGCRVALTGSAVSQLFKGFSRAENLNTFSGALPVTNLTMTGTTQTGFTTLISSTTTRYMGLFVQYPLLTATAAGTMVYDIAIGSSGNEVVVATMVQNNIIHGHCDQHVFCDVPVGSRISFRFVSSSASSNGTLAPSILGLIP